MRITRRFTQAGTDVFSTIKWTKRSSRINNADGSVVFEMNDAEVPEAWSQLATDIMVSKYFRKAGVPAYKADGTIDTDAPTGTRAFRQTSHWPLGFLLAELGRTTRVLRQQC